MSALLKKFWYISVGILLGATLYFTTCNRPTPPPPSAVQIAAEHAAGAIVVGEHLDTALAQHRADSVARTPAKHRVQSLHQRATVAIQHLDSLHRDTTTTATEIFTAASGVIATQDSLVQSQDSLLAKADADNARLARATTEARDSIKPYETPIIPATVIHTSVGAKIVGAALSALQPTVGYGAIYDGHTITHGPSATVGLHLTSGSIGATAGATAVYASGSVHFGAGITVGVRL